MFKVKVIFQDNSSLSSIWETEPILGCMCRFAIDGYCYSVVEISEDKKTVWVEDVPIINIDIA